MPTTPHPDEAVVRVRATLTVEFEVFAEFATEAELRELLDRCKDKGENRSAVGLRRAIEDHFSDFTSRIGYTADGEKDAWLGEAPDVSVAAVEVLP